MQVYGREERKSLLPEYPGDPDYSWSSPSMMNSTPSRLAPNEGFGSSPARLQRRNMASPSQQTTAQPKPAGQARALDHGAVAWRNVLTVATVTAGALWVLQLAAMLSGDRSRHWDMPLVTQTGFDDWGSVFSQMNATEHKMQAERALGAPNDFIHRSFANSLNNGTLRCALGDNALGGTASELCVCLQDAFEYSWGRNESVMEASFFCFSKRFHHYTVEPYHGFAMRRVNPHVVLLWTQAISLSMCMIHASARVFYNKPGIGNARSSLLYLMYGVIAFAIVGTAGVDLAYSGGSTSFWVLLLAGITMGLYYTFWNAVVDSSYNPIHAVAQNSELVRALVHHDLQSLLSWAHAAVVFTLLFVTASILAGTRQYDVILVTGLTVWAAMLAGAGVFLVRSFLVHMRIQAADEFYARAFASDGAWTAAVTAVFAAVWLVGFQLDTQWDTSSMLTGGEPPYSPAAPLPCARHLPAAAACSQAVSPPIPQPRPCPVHGTCSRLQGRRAGFPVHPGTDHPWLCGALTLSSCAGYRLPCAMDRGLRRDARRAHPGFRAHRLVFGAEPRHPCVHSARQKNVPLPGGGTRAEGRGAQRFRILHEHGHHDDYGRRAHSFAVRGFKLREPLTEERVQVLRGR